MFDLCVVLADAASYIETGFGRDSGRRQSKYADKPQSYS
jgi:hypothetical protein